MRRRSTNSFVDITVGFQQRIDWLIRTNNSTAAARLYGAIYSIDEQRHNPHNGHEPFYRSLIDGRADALFLASFNAGREATVDENVQFAIECGQRLYTYYIEAHDQTEG